MPPWSSWSRSTTPRSSIRPSRTGIRATRTARAASTTSSPSAATAAARTRRFPGPSSRPARRSPGNIRAASCAATIRAASSIRSRSRTATSRSIAAPRCCISARTRRAASSPRASRPGTRNNTYRGLVTAHRQAKGARNFTNCDLLLIGDKCGAHTVPYIEAKNSSAVFEHEATTSKISEDMLFYCRQRGLSAEEAVALVVNGFVKDVLQQLPMEFAVEAQKLISISLEGSVGYGRSTVLKMLDSPKVQESKSFEWHLLEIKNLHVEVDGKKILNGLDLTVEKGAGARHHGPERLGQVDARLCARRQGRLRRHRGRGAARRREHSRHGARRARRQGPVPRLPVSARNPGRRHHDVPAHRAQRAAQDARRGRAFRRPSS